MPERLEWKPPEQCGTRPRRYRHLRRPRPRRLVPRLQRQAGNLRPRDVHGSLTAFCCAGVNKKGCPISHAFFLRGKWGLADSRGTHRFQRSSVLGRYNGNIPDISLTFPACSGLRLRNSKPQSLPRIRRTTAAAAAPPTGSSSTASPTFKPTPTAADIPPSLISMLIPLISGRPLDRTVIGALSRYRGNLLRSAMTSGTSLAIVVVLLVITPRSGFNLGPLCLCARNAPAGGACPGQRRLSGRRRLIDQHPKHPNLSNRVAELFEIDRLLDVSVHS